MSDEDVRFIDAGAVHYVDIVSTSGDVIEYGVERAAATKRYGWHPTLPTPDHSMARRRREVLARNPCIPRRDALQSQQGQKGVRVTLRTYNGFTGPERSAGGKWYAEELRSGRRKAPTVCVGCGRRRGSVRGHSEITRSPSGTTSARSGSATPATWRSTAATGCRSPGRGTATRFATGSGSEIRRATQSSSGGTPGGIARRRARCAMPRRVPG